jgi:6-phosphogluconolactonase (cycloisomerase 2 family)
VAAWLLLLLPALASAQVRPASVYVGNEESESISQFRRQAAGGLIQLSPASLAVGGSPIGLAASPNGRYLYAAVAAPEEANPINAYVAEFSVGPDGTITPLATPRLSLGARPTSISISPDGRHVYVTDYDGVTSGVAQFAVGANGELAPLSPARVPVEGAEAIAISPDSRHVYVIDGEASGLVWQFEAAPDGTLQPLVPASVAAGFKPYALAISPDDRNVYVIINREELLQYTVNADGTLHPLAPAAAPSAGLMGAVAVTPDGREVIAGEFDGVERFERRADGTLASLGTPTPVEGAPFAIAIPSDGRNLYLANAFSSGGNGLLQFGLGPEAMLEPLSPASLETGSDPRSIAVSPESEVGGAISTPSSNQTSTAPPAGLPAPAVGSLLASPLATPGRRSRHGEIFSFDATLSIDTGASIDSYSWSVNGRLLATTPRFSHFFSNAKRSYRVTLTVRDSLGRLASASITVFPRASRPPVVRVTIPATAMFCINCADPSPAMARLVQGLRHYARGARLVSIASYADATGSSAYNLALTRQRTEAVAQLLLTGLRPAPHRVSLTWHGESDPIASNGTAAGRARNRRAVIRIVR